LCVRPASVWAAPAMAQRPRIFRPARQPPRSPASLPVRTLGKVNALTLPAFTLMTPRMPFIHHRTNVPAQPGPCNAPAAAASLPVVGCRNACIEAKMFLSLAGPLKSSLTEQLCGQNQHAQAPPTPPRSQPSAMHPQQQQHQQQQQEQPVAIQVAEQALQVDIPRRTNTVSTSGEDSE
jgi:hypothetical protein